jgi:thiosulfate/3-mercaptopyruvate sulfurtransferase
VDHSWLAAHRPEVVLTDVRFYLDGSSASAAYEAGHLPGAVYVDLERWLAAQGSPELGRHPLPTPETFAEGMSRSGIGDDDTVIAYDDAGGIIASRLVWMLRATGHDAALLDGGLTSYDGPLETGPDPAAGTRSRGTTSAQFTPVPWPADRLADLDGVVEAAAGPATRTVVVDARQRERYLGGEDLVDPRSGHIPGARSLPCRENLDADGTFLPVDQLRERFAAVGVTAAGDGADLIAYCGSGVSACHDLIAQEHAGLGLGRLYPGSWSQYSNAAERPVETVDPLTR